jgi:hypothetical protein
VVDPASAAAQAAAKQRLQDTPVGKEVERLRAMWSAWQPAGVQDPAVPVTAAEGVTPAALRSVLEGWEAAGVMASSFVSRMLEQLGSRDGWDLGWETPRFFNSSIRLRTTSRRRITSADFPKGL